MAAASKLLKNFVILFAGNVIGQLLFFVGLAYLARVLGPSGFGLWNFAQVFMLYLLRVGEFGLEVVGIRDTARNPDSMSSWIATVVSVRCVMAFALFGFAVLISAADFLPDGTSSLVLISALALFPMALLLEWVFESRQEVGLISASRILKGLLFFLGVLLIVSSSTDAETAAYLYVASLVLPGVVIFLIAVGRFGFDWSSVSIGRGLDVLGKSAPIGIATLFSQYSLSFATLVVGYFLTSEELGFFTAAHRIVLFLWAYVITSMHRVLLPSLSGGWQTSPPQYQRFVERFFRLSVLAAVPVGLVGTLCATDLMQLLYSAQYESSGTVFAILLWAFALATVRSILEIALIASDEQRRYMKGMALLSIAYTVLTPPLTLAFGIVGAGVAVVSAELFYFTYLVLSSPVSSAMSLLRNFWKPAVSAIVAMGVLIPFPDLHPVLRVMLGSTVFGALVVALRGMTAEDLDAMRSLFRRGGLDPREPGHLRAG